MSDSGEVFYTYSKSERQPDEPRWRDDDTGYEIFETFEDAKADVLALRAAIKSEGEAIWAPMQIEKIVMRPMVRANLLTLLNKGMAAAVAEHEIIEVI